MSCAKQTATFRLLDCLVGWDKDTVEGIVGLDDKDGLRLAPLDQHSATVPTELIAPWLTPANLDYDDCECAWYLVTPCPPQSQLLRIDPCSDCFNQPWPGALEVLECATAVAVCDERIAVTDSGRGAILFFTDGGKRQLGSVPLSAPGPISCTSWDEWLVVDRDIQRLVQMDLAGFSRGVHPAPLPGIVNRIAVDADCRIWLAVDEPALDGIPQSSLWYAERDDLSFAPASFGELQMAFVAAPISTTNEQGFCLTTEYRCGPCFSWYGRPLQEPLESTATKAQYVRQGQLLTVAIDSGVPRCRWHRVRLDACIPQNTLVSIAVSTSDDASPAAQGVATSDWSNFAVGLPHPDDWQAPLDSTDFLIQQPPGRHLFVRIRLNGDGIRTPRVQRVRLDFPRQTSLNLLPAVFRKTPAVEDFSERFLSLFDAYLDDVDEQIDRLPAILDIAGVPDELMPWLGSFLDIVMDPAWDGARRRRLLQAAPRLYRMRGTVDGMRAAIRLVFDVEPAIRERGNERPWGSVGTASLNGGVRLFGPSQWRFRLDRSRLSQARIRGFGQPDLDPFAAVAYRFDVMVPLTMDDTGFERLQQLVDAQKPAHTVVRLRDSDGRFSVGRGVAVGIDTTFRGFDPTVLGHEGGISLSRDAVLSAAKRTGHTGMIVGQNSAIGVNRQME